MDKLTFSFDIGYASIGWGVLKGGAAPEVSGAGVVLFPKDDCLASKRRVYRRMRRTIRSRRQRIERIGRILEHHGVISAPERQLPGHPAPFWLAARALAGKVKLSGLEVWHLMRWYAHHRGYDGNSLWAGDEHKDEDDDTAKVEAAKANMQKMGTTTMAETVTRLLGLELEGNQASTKAYKTLDMAFPREIVRAEVERLLLEHSELPEYVAQLILGNVEQQREELVTCGVSLPRRFVGSVLFGQLVPRFDNRIIARCPITWAIEYTKALSEGQGEEAARSLADKFAKVPKADCREFYEYRFARILCNIRAAGKPLSAAQRMQLMNRAREVGRFTATSFKKAVKELIGDVPSNLYNFFQIHPDSDKALIVDPVKGGGPHASGRAPYARPVLRQVVEEVLRGEDPTKPARTLEHPEGEVKEQDGVLYSLADPESEVSRLQAIRRVEDMSNNHLVRHRMLIFKRLLKDMLNKYAHGDASRVGQFCIEVGRELSEFSGKSSQDIAKELNERMKHFRSAVKRLQERAPLLPLSAGLIRKCRIAMDMDWTCPFTGQKYGEYDLPKLEREHIIPHANRNSNSLASLVLTWPAVNRMKGKRTGMQFVKECGGQEIPGTTWSVMTEKRYAKLVEKLDTKGAPDDQRRKKQRKQFLLVDALTEKTLKEENLGFTEGVMTQSSQLMKIARHVARKVCPKASVCMIPGSVTAAVRRTWKAWGLLGKVCPEVLMPEGGARPKDEIRGITHLHHAVDACVLGLIPLLIPSGTNGIVWQALGMRRLTEEQVARLREVTWGDMLSVDESRQVHLQPLPHAVQESFVRALEEERVVTHVPADMSGAKLEETTWGVLKVEDGVAYLHQRSYKNVAGERVGAVKQGPKVCESVSKLVGMSPVSESKLKVLKGVRVIGENYGVALTPMPEVIPHHNVYKRLAELRRKYGEFRMVRKGQLIDIRTYKDKKRLGMWRVMSCKNNQKRGALFDLQRPYSSRSLGETHEDTWKEVGVKMLMGCGLQIIARSYIAEKNNRE